MAKSMGTPLSNVVNINLNATAYDDIWAFSHFSKLLLLCTKP